MLSVVVGVSKFYSYLPDEAGSIVRVPRLFNVSGQHLAINFVQVIAAFVVTDRIAAVCRIICFLAWTFWKYL